MKNVSAAIIIQDNCILIARRSSNEKQGGFWEFPGGKQEDDETIEQCLVREIQEELDLKIQCERILTESIYHYEGGAIRLIAIQSKILSGTPKLQVHDKIEWTPIEELLNYKLAPADIPIAKWIIAHRPIVHR